MQQLTCSCPLIDLAATFLFVSLGLVAVATTIFFLTEAFSRRKKIGSEALNEPVDAVDLVFAKRLDLSKVSKEYPRQGQFADSKRVALKEAAALLRTMRSVHAYRDYHENMDEVLDLIKKAE